MPKTTPTPTKRLPQTVSIIALLFVLIGIFVGLRTISNLFLFTKYPNSGALSFGQSYGQKEEDCAYPQTYFDYEGKPRPATAQEKQISTDQQEMCLKSVANSRHTTKVNDVSLSIFFLFIGLGLMIGKKYV